ncbi:hypothetical protein E2P64_00750 [Candidatus Bathyarchaeota archaeon]|nr:hypothetical protein E2P64_00750 [Candidatus Bathyarchaeota archaeon]
MQKGDILTKKDLKKFKGCLTPIRPDGNDDIYCCGKGWDYFAFKIEHLDDGLNGSYEVKDVWNFEKGEKFQEDNMPDELGWELLRSGFKDRYYGKDDKRIELTREGNPNFPGEWTLTYVNRQNAKSLKELRGC